MNITAYKMQTLDTDAFDLIDPDELYKCLTDMCHLKANEEGDMALSRLSLYLIENIVIQMSDDVVFSKLLSKAIKALCKQCDDKDIIVLHVKE